MGEAACFAAIAKADKQEKKKEKVESDAPRVAWHGEYYRQEFYHQEIPALMCAVEYDDRRHLALTLAIVVYTNQPIHAWFHKEMCQEVSAETERWFRLPFHEILRTVCALNDLQQHSLLADAMVQISLCKDLFVDFDRQALAEFLNIDFGQFQVTEEYLNKKTKAELVRYIAHDSGLLQDVEFLTFLEGRGTSTEAEKLAQEKKGVLVDLILQCGVDLHGRLPKEIADRPEHRPKL
jgi:hypothetical protein